MRLFAHSNHNVMNTWSAFKLKSFLFWTGGRRPGISVYLAEMVANMRAQIKTAGENCQIFGGRVEQKLEEFLKSL